MKIMMRLQDTSSRAAKPPQLQHYVVMHRSCRGASCDTRDQYRERARCTCLLDGWFSLDPHVTRRYRNKVPGTFYLT